MSYLSELNKLAASSSEDAGKFNPKEVYAQLLSVVMARNIRVYRDMYGDEIDVQMVGTPGKTPVAVLDFSNVPLVTMRSVHVYKLIDMICIKLNKGYVERGTLCSDLRVRLSKVVPTAGLRAYDVQITQTFGKHTAAELQTQHRCAIFPLERLVTKAGLTMEEVLVVVGPQSSRKSIP